MALFPAGLEWRLSQLMRNWNFFVSSFKKREVATGYVHSPETLLSSFSEFSLFPSESHRGRAWLWCSWLEGRE